MSQSRIYNGERHMIFIPRDGSAVEVHRYSMTDMSAVFSGSQLVEINHDGRTQDASGTGVWIDMIWAALHYVKLAEAAAKVAK